MILWIIRALVVLLGPVIGYFQISRDFKGALIGFVIFAVIIGIELLVGKVPLDTLVASGIGIILGFVVGYLIEYGLISLGNERLIELMSKYSLIVKSSFVVLGFLIAIRKKEEVDLLDKNILKTGAKTSGEKVKILDTSAIIDGRIADVSETRFLEGPMIIPNFVLAELHKLADSSDSNKRVRARRGLEIMRKLQDEPNMSVKVYDKDYPEIKEVDTKLVILAKEIGGTILTTDFNLNKIASLQGVIVLNINDLANSLKPIYLPGETMNMFVVKEGKEHDQGIGYLDDGTMIVVEDGRKHIGKKVDVIVTSALQTSAGRMIFTKPR
ncbi:MAG: TRAM domain-containing protein [Elusimicrobia bacterium]|nr:TRAM domain-containing protein [Elusimicrobiota bacterium]MBU2614191.1 TRAM domain-containing protein [Elusimicrobiota bacterium]